MIGHIITALVGIGLMVKGAVYLFWEITWGTPMLFYPDFWACGQILLGAFLLWLPTGADISLGFGKKKEER